MAERRGPVGAIVLLALAVAVAGCGGGDAKGATVTVYASVPLRGTEKAAGERFCAAARKELPARAKDGSFKVKLVCLDSGVGKRSWTLAKTGAIARRATEDTSAVALLERPGEPTRFTRPILEAAGIPLVISTSGEGAMARTLKAIAEGGGSAIRDSVREALEPGA